ncbi:MULTISPECIES: hypothetical protein [Pseudoalteromonas]|uniref:hypothetical protein n=1 Tax=Pseudoalteromonas TaxID=53246 RepID=UPI00040B8DF6|nr:MULTISPECIES: hypothetical protein [unclassified Pseudoalteromonas]MCC9662875.1 hypothetical protein [Pseudoalteromonas sp. MB41]MDC3188975.1 hypothetical protein [Pseudoalteromonas elyakovii]
MLKSIVLSALTLAAFTFTSATQALEPLPDRARVSSMQAQLLLPDSSSLSVDMNFDCGSAFESTGMIITNERGAQLLAAAYTHMYGQEAGEFVMQQWYTKKHPDDPRKPTFLIVKPNQNINWEKPATAKTSLLQARTLDAQSVSSDDATPDYQATVESFCGTRNHVQY